MVTRPLIDSQLQHPLLPPLPPLRLLSLSLSFALLSPFSLSLSLVFFSVTRCLFIFDIFFLVICCFVPATSISEVEKLTCLISSLSLSFSPSLLSFYYYPPLHLLLAFRFGIRLNRFAPFQIQNIISINIYRVRLKQFCRRGRSDSVWICFLPRV